MAFEPRSEIPLASPGLAGNTIREETANVWDVGKWW